MIMKKIICPIALFISLLVFISGIRASHLMSAEIAWSSIGQDSFLIKLTVYTDCNSSNTLGTSPINFKCATSGASITSVNITPGTPIDITPICKSSCTRCQSAGCSFPYGIHKYTMQGLVMLNGAGNCCQISMSWSQSARSSAITTIPGASGYDIYIEGLLNRCQGQITNSPQFSNDPVIIACVGQDLTLKMGAMGNTLQPGDSISFDWGHPMGGPGNYLTYSGQYDYDKPAYFWGFPMATLPLPRGIHLDPNTGTIKFRPMKAEVSVMVVQADIFRNSIKIAEVRREIFFISISCTGNQKPILSVSDNQWSKSVCLGKSPNGSNVVDFYFTSADSDANDSLTISCNDTIRGSVWTDNNGKVKNPEGHFHWVANDQNANLSTYKFTVTLKDNGCPFSNVISKVININVLKIPVIKQKFVKLGCGAYRFDIDSSFGTNFSARLWIAGTWHILPKPAVYQAEKPGIYPYIIQISVPGYCDYTDTDFLFTDTFVYSKFLPADTTVCEGSSKNFDIKLPSDVGPCKYKWSTGDTTNSLQTGPLVADTKIKLTITSVSGCAKSDSTLITVKPNPAITIKSKFQMCEHSFVFISPIFTFHGSNNYFKSCEWTKAGDSSYSDFSTAIYASDTGIYYLKVTDSYGCQALDSIDVYIKPIDTAIFVNSPDISVAPGMKTYTWYRNYQVVSIGSSNTYKALQSGLYYAVLTDSINCTITTRSIYISLAGMNQSSGQPVFRLYPNPTNGILTLETTGTLTGDVIIKLMNAYGREIMNRTFKPNDLQTAKEFDVSDQSAGTYTVIIRYQNASFHQLIIKE